MQQAKELANQLPRRSHAVFRGASFSGRMDAAFGQQFIANFSSILFESLPAAAGADRRSFCSSSRVVGDVVFLFVV
jgi:hypothetical protein